MKKKKKVKKPARGLGMDISKLSATEQATWHECNWCYANSCYMCGHRDTALKHGWI